MGGRRRRGSLLRPGGLRPLPERRAPRRGCSSPGTRLSARRWLCAPGGARFSPPTTPGRGNRGPEREVDWTTVILGSRPFPNRSPPPHHPRALGPSPLRPSKALGLAPSSPRTSTRDHHRRLLPGVLRLRGANSQDLLRRRPLGPALSDSPLVGPSRSSPRVGSPPRPAPRTSGFSR